MFRKPNILPNSCTLKYVKFISNIWYRLEETNSWNFVTNTENIIIKCRNISEPIEIKVNRTGIFSLDINCEVNADEGTILIPKVFYSLKISTCTFRHRKLKIRNDVPGRHTAEMTC